MFIIKFLYHLHHTTSCARQESGDSTVTNQAIKHCILLELTMLLYSPEVNAYKLRKKNAYNSLLLDTIYGKY